VKRRRAKDAHYLCPSCCQEVDTSPDPGAGGAQEYVEDCPVCCRPNVISATWSDDEGTWVIEARPEND
jgi:hypothetical protein